MQTYTKDQIVMIDEATIVARDLLGMARQLLSNFINDYLLSEIELESLIFDAKADPEKVRQQILVINHLLFEASAELAVFGDPDAAEVQSVLSLAAEKENIIKKYKEKN